MSFNTLTTQSIADFFDKIAKQYHESRLSNNKLFSDFIEKPAILECIDGIERTGKLLDIGCGSGIYSRMFSECGYSVVAVDVSSEMLKIAKEYCFGLNISFIHSSLQDFNYAPSEFDVVFGSFITGYYSDLNNMFSKLSNLVRKNGVVLITMLHPVRTASFVNEHGAYVISNYFDHNKYMASILADEDKLPLYKHLFTDVINSASCVGLKLEKMLEPTPVKPPSHIDASLYYKCPSIAVFCFRAG